MVYKIADNIFTPIGSSTDENFQSVLHGRSALKQYAGYKGLKEDFCLSLFSDEQINDAYKNCKDSQISGDKVITRFEAVCLYSIKKALAQTDLDLKNENVALIISSTKGNVELLDTPSYIDLASSAQRIADIIGVNSLPIVVCNACISGVSAIICAKRLIESGSYDYAIVCGAEVLNQFVISGFQALKVLSDEPCRPFDIERIGLNLGEGAAAMILCSSRVKPMNTKKLWRIDSAASRNDAFHITSPSKDSIGAYLSLKRVSENIDKESIAFINAHGTASLFNDQMESVAIERANLSSLWVNGYKGYFGHTLGAAGVIESVLSMKAIENKTIVATKGFNENGVSGKMKLSDEPIETNKERFIKMISGFGGCNAAFSATLTDSIEKDDAKIYDEVLTDNELANWDELKVRNISSHNHSYRVTHNVKITPKYIEIDGQMVKNEEVGDTWLNSIYKKKIGDYPKFYKMDSLSKLGFVASELLLNLEGGKRFIPRSDRAVMFFNHNSSISADISYLRTFVNKDDYYPSPSIFIYTLPNIVTGEIALRNKYNGESSFYILPRNCKKTINDIIFATFVDSEITSILTGWLDYKDEGDFIADLQIIEKF